MLTLVLALTLAASEPQPVKLASTGWNYVGIDASKGDFFSDYFSQQIAMRGGIRVTTSSEINALVGMERQRQLLGCSKDSSDCLAELAGALGVDGLIVGSLAKIGSQTVVNVKVVKATDGRPLALYSERLNSEEALLDWLSATAEKLARKVRSELGHADAPVVAQQPAPPPVTTPTPAPQPAPPATTQSAPPAQPTTVTQAPSDRLTPRTVPAGDGPAAPPGASGGLRSWWWAPAAASGAALVGSVTMWAFAYRTYAALGRGDDISDFDDIAQVRSTGELQQNTAYALGGVSAALAAGAAGVYLFGAPRPELSATVGAGPGGAVVVVQGVLP